MILNNKEMEKIFRDDDLDTFKKINNLDDMNLKKHINTYLGISLYLENNNKITLYLANKYGVTYNDYGLIVSKLNKYKFDKVKYYDWQRTFLNIFIHNKANYDEISIIINKLIKIEEWIIIEFLHLFDYRAKNQDLLVKKYPELLYKRLQNYGYDIKHRYITSKIIQNDHEYILKFINNNNLCKWKDLIFEHCDVDLIKKMINRKITSLNEIKKEKYITILCEKNNMAVIKYLVNEGIKLQNTDYYELLGIRTKDIDKLKRNMCRRYNWNAIQPEKLPLNFENNFIEIIEKCNYNINYNRYLYEIIIANRLFDILGKLMIKYPKVKMIKNRKRIYINMFIKKDDIYSFKKMIEHEIIKIDHNSSNLLSKYLTFAIYNNSSNIMKYLKENYNVKCSIFKSDIAPRYNFMEFIKNLEYVEYPINEKILIMAYTSDNIEATDYLIRNKGLKISIKNLLSSEFLCCSTKTISYILNNIKYLSKKKLVDKILENTSLSYKLLINKIKLIIKLTNTTATEISLKYAVRTHNCSLFKYLHKKFNLEISAELLKYLELYTYDRHDYEIPKYVINHVRKDIMTIDNINKFMNMALRSQDIDILKTLENEYNCFPSDDQIYEAININKYRKDFIDYILKDKDIIPENVIETIISDRSVNILYHLYDNHRDKIDFDRLFTIKKINTYTLLNYGGLNFYVFIKDKLKEDITLYTIELFIKNTEKYRFNIYTKKIIKYLLDQKGVITTNIINLLYQKGVITADIINLIKRNKYIHMKGIGKTYKIVENYEPEAGEIPDVNNNEILINNIDEVDLAIKEAEMIN